MSTGKPMTYENWNAGEPNNFQYENGEQEHCLELWNRDGKGLRWNDTPCSFETFFVCEVWEKVWEQKSDNKKFKRGAGERGVFNSRSKREETLCRAKDRVTGTYLELWEDSSHRINCITHVFREPTVQNTRAKLVQKFVQNQNLLPVRQVPERVTDWLQRIKLGVSEK